MPDRLTSYISGPRAVRRGLTGLLGLAVIAGGLVVVPQAVRTLALVSAQDDPEALTRLRLADAATPDQIAHEIDAAVDAGDRDLAQSFLDLAADQHVPVDAARRNRVTPAAAPSAAQDLVQGVTTGSGWIGTAGSYASDLVGISDLRDLWQEGGKLYAGQSYDPFVLGLSVAGLGLTGITVAAVLPTGAASLETKAPVARGLAALKAARRSGLLSRPLIERIGAMTMRVVDTDALKGAVTAARGLDLAGAQRAVRSAIRPEAVQALGTLGSDVVALEGKIGQRGAAQALNTVADSADLGRVRRLAQAEGSRTRAILKILGTGAILLGDITALVLQTAGWLLLWSFGLALFARRTGTAIGRLIWRRTTAKAALR